MSHALMLHTHSHTHITHSRHTHHTPTSHTHTGEDIFSSGGGGSRASKDDDDLFAELDQNKPMSPLGKSIRASVSIWEGGREGGQEEKKNERIEIWRIERWFADL